MDIRELDKNMNFEGVTSENLTWYDRYTPGFSFDGCEDLDHFQRIKAEDLPGLPFGIREGCRSTGITLRFRTNATTIALKAVLWVPTLMSNMCLSGSSGFDFYFAEVPEEGKVSLLPRYMKTYIPSAAALRVVSGEYTFPDWRTKGAWHDIELGFPLYNGVDEFYIGLNEGAEILPPSPLAMEKPILFYGSSITQGASASRPGTCYTTMLARTLRLPQRNIGYSGKAKAEPEMNAYLAKQDMGIFVMDYDHNADTVEYLNDTHERLFKTVRASHPELPIVMISRPNYDANPADSEARFAVIEKTYQNALAAGDRNVYLVDFRNVFEEDQRDACTIDSCHPTDLGFYRMYKATRPVIEEILGKMGK